MNNTVLIMAGGTGGHVFPALAVAHQLTEKGHAVHWLGTDTGIESELVTAKGYPLHVISIKGLRGKGILGLVSAPLKIIKATCEAYSILKKINPAAVLGMGGYVTGPGGLAAKLFRVPLLIHEQNAIPGMTNKILNRIANVSFQAFPGSLKNAITTGNPVRQDIFNVEPYQSGSKRLNVLVVGGSLGAVAVNDAVLQALQSMPDNERPKVWHQAGKRNYEQLKEQYESAGIEVKLTAFIDNMMEAYQWSDIVVCRAGALTVSEIAAAGRTAIFVPYPYAVDDHQTINAMHLSNNDAAILCPQKELSADWLVKKWRYLDENRQALLDMANRARTLATTDSTGQVVEYIERQIS